MKDLLQFEASELNPVHFMNALFITIVLYLHHGQYTNFYFGFLNEYNLHYVLQKFAVGGFFFFSGLKLTISNLDIPISTFLTKRFYRIYLLYLLSILVASISSYPFLNGGIYPSFKNIIMHALCVQSIFPNLFGQNFHVLWFVSVLFICYLSFLHLRKYVFNPKSFLLQQILISSVISLCYFFTIDKHITLFSKDFSVYFLFFSSGMVLSEIRINQINEKIFLLFGFIGTLLLFIFYKNIYVNTWYEYIIYVSLVLVTNICLFCFLTIWIRSVNFSKNTKIILAKYSFSSFCIFLFQRSIWAAMASIYPKGTFSQWLYIIFLGVPVIILSSYFIQYYFNLSVHYCTTKVFTRR